MSWTYQTACIHQCSILLGQVNKPGTPNLLDSVATVCNHPLSQRRCLSSTDLLQRNYSHALCGHAGHRHSEHSHMELYKLCDLKNFRHQPWTIPYLLSFVPILTLLKISLYIFPPRTHLKNNSAVLPMGEVIDLS